MCVIIINTSMLVTERSGEEGSKFLTPLLGGINSTHTSFSK